MTGTFNSAHCTPQASLFLSAEAFVLPGRIFKVYVKKHVHDIKIFCMMNKAILEGILPHSENARNEKLLLSKNCFTSHNALTLYQYLKLSLLDVNNWRRYKSGIPFQSKLVDQHGRQVGRIARSGDRLKILQPRWRGFLKIYDWFEIQTVEEQLRGNTEVFFITIVPCADPEADLTLSAICPKRESSLTFFIIRDDHKVQLEIHSREQAVSFSGTNLKCKIENIVYSFFTQSRFNNNQWRRLLKSLLNEGSSNFTNLN